MIRGEVPEKARQAYGMGCGGVDTIPDTAAGVIGVGADDVGREAEAAGDVRDGEAVDGHERWRRSRRTQLMVLMIKELTQQAQATTASQRSTRGVARAMAIAMTAKPIAAAMARGSRESRSFPGGLVREGREVHLFLAL